MFTHGQGGGQDLILKEWRKPYDLSQCSALLPLQKLAFPLNTLLCKTASGERHLLQAKLLCHKQTSWFLGRGCFTENRQEEVWRAKI